MGSHRAICRPRSLLPDLQPDMRQSKIEDVAADREATELERHARTRGRRLLSKLTVGSRVRV